MSSSRDRVEDTYETQNDQRLDDLHSKLRTLRTVTTDIYDDVERQNTTLDDTRNTFNSFGSSLAQSSRRASQAFGIGKGGVKQWRTIGYCIITVMTIWMMWKMLWWWYPASPSSPSAPVPP